MRHLFCSCLHFIGVDNSEELGTVMEKGYDPAATWILTPGLLLSLLSTNTTYAADCKIAQFYLPKVGILKIVQLQCKIDTECNYTSDICIACLYMFVIHLYFSDSTSVLEMSEENNKSNNNTACDIYSSLYPKIT